MKYIKRVVDKKIEKYLKIFKSLYIKGLKWCEKTTTHSKSVFIVDNEKANLNYEIFKYEALNIGEKQFDDDAAKFIKTCNIVSTLNGKKPKFMAIITGYGKEIYIRKDNVYVIPISMLKD